MDNIINFKQAGKKVAKIKKKKRAHAKRTRLEQKKLIRVLIKKDRKPS